MEQALSLIANLGLPIASGLIMGYFIFLIMKQLMGNLVAEIKTVQGITKMLITRASIMNNDIIRIDTSVSSALNLPPDLDRIARAENFVEDGKIDARRD
jgi:flavoprotein|tara:strand:+ start:1283 stop:1579 length:297 start_codon:yes stop_codon:yes gene_type:complete